MADEATATHTPGPWEIEGERGDRVCGILGPLSTGPCDSEDIECTYTPDFKDVVSWRRRIIETDSGFYPPRLADARLIAAAPDLLAALKAIVIEGGGGFFRNLSGENFAAALAAIAKAEGAK